MKQSFDTSKNLCWYMWVRHYGCKACRDLAKT